MNKELIQLKQASSEFNAQTAKLSQLKHMKELQQINLEQVSDKIEIEKQKIKIQKDDNKR